jgi:Tfp pilus assembly protein PilF
VSRICLLWALPLVVLAHPAIETQISDVSRAIVQAPDSPALYLRRGLLHTQHGDRELARQDFEAARALTDSADVQIALGNLYFSEDDPVRAGEHFARAIEMADESPSAWLGQAKTAVALGANELALLSYRAYFQFADNPQPGYLAAAVRDIAPHDRQAAIALLNDALKRLGPVPTLTKLAEKLNQVPY